MFAQFKGIVMFCLLVLNTLFWLLPVYVSILLKVLTPARSRTRIRCSALVAFFAQSWMACNCWLGDHLLDIRWDVRVPQGLSPRKSYLVFSNHQSWNDIYALMRCCNGRVPFFKFFLKQQLIWVPVLGLTWWGLDYPFMKRYTREQIAANPELKGKDMETTRKACEKYAHQPVAVLNFLEGTRFTPAKHDRQQSPYRHLLKPRAGGLAFALNALGDKLSALLDITIVYPRGSGSLWDFLSGRVKHIVVDIRRLDVPLALCNGDYQEDPAFRQQVQDWVGQLWAGKDQRIDQLLAEYGASETDSAASPA